MDDRTGGGADPADADADADPADADVDADRRRRRVLWSMPTGLFLVGSRDGDRCNLMTANWVMQVATAPPLVAVSLESGSVTRSLVEASGRFIVNVLDVADRALVRSFVKPVREVAVDGEGRLVSLQGVPVHEVGATTTAAADSGLGAPVATRPTDGLPAVDAALGWVLCRVTSWVPLPASTSHRVAIGEVVGVGERDTPPATGAARPEQDGESGRPLRMSDTRMNYGG